MGLTASSVVSGERATAGDDKEVAMVDHQYWFCLTHHRVEGGEGCRNQDRLGPYPSPEAAARALETVAERNEAWENDPDWNDDLER
jgi:hypothetical protein